MSARPRVVVNVAATADGKIDTFERRGAAISSAADRRRVDVLRAASDAVMVGTRTLLEEDPRLIVRDEAVQAERIGRGLPPNPAKVSLLSRPSALRLDSRFLTAGQARIIVFTPRVTAESDVELLRARGVEVYALGEPRVDLSLALAKLAQVGIDDLLVEGGGSLNFELLRLGLVDELQVFVAPLLFGGASAPTLADGQGLVRDLAINLSRIDAELWPDGGVLLRYKVEGR